MCFQIAAGNPLHFVRKSVREPHTKPPVTPHFQARPLRLTDKKPLKRENLGFILIKENPNKPEPLCRMERKKTDVLLERRSRVSRGRRAYAMFNAAIPALAICASSLDFTPLTPTAPIQTPSFMTGTPPSNNPEIAGALRKEVRP